MKKKKGRLEGYALNGIPQEEKKDFSRKVTKGEKNLLQNSRECVGDCQRGRGKQKQEQEERRRMSMRGD